MKNAFAVRICGLRVAVGADRAEWVPKLQARLPPGSVAAAGRRPHRRYEVRRAGRSVTVSRDGEALAEPASLKDALDLFEADVQLQVAEWSPSRVFVHAGVVAWRGRAIVIPGRSGSGKSRLVAALVRAGAEYYSDEYAVLDARGRVHPFPVPLSLRREGRGSAPPLRVGVVVVTRFRKGAGWAPRPLSRGRAVLEVLAHAVCARTRPAAALAAVTRALADAVALKGNRGEAKEVASRLVGV